MWKNKEEEEKEEEKEEEQEEEEEQKEEEEDYEEEEQEEEQEERLETRDLQLLVHGRGKGGKTGARKRRLISPRPPMLKFIIFRCYSSMYIPTVHSFFTFLKISFVRCQTMREPISLSLFFPIIAHKLAD